MRRCIIAVLGTIALISASFTAMAEDSPGRALSEAAGVPWPTVIAHRGASHDAPEETAPAYLAARDLGADYLEADLQRTKDGVLVAVHDDTLERTSNIAKVFPGREKDPVSQFTLAELKRLDAGSWFNSTYPERARSKYAGLRILTLDELIDIAEGGGETPGLYLETKAPGQFPGIEEDLRKVLENRGWLNSDGEPQGRIVLQTFEKSSLELLQKSMPKVPKVLLLWVGDGYMAAKSATPFAQSGERIKADFYARQEVKSKEELFAWLDWAKANGALGVGPSATLTARGDQSYMDLVQPWMNQAAHERGLFVHAYTVDDAVDFDKLTKAGVDGFFSNRTDQLLTFIGRPASQSVDEVLKSVGY